LPLQTLRVILKPFNKDYPIFLGTE